VITIYNVILKLFILAEIKTQVR